PKPTAPSSTPLASAPTPATPAEPAPPEEGEKPATAPAPAAVGAALPISLEALSNLLPNDTEGICNVRMKDLMRTSLGRTIFATPGAFRSEAVQHRLGLAVEDIDLMIQGWNFTQNWSF